MTGKLNMSIVNFQNVFKNYKMGKIQVSALKNIDLEIEKGEYVAIMGPSGSGKSTILNLLGCLDKPSQGKYELDGKDVSKLNDEQLSNIRGKKVGFIFQSYNLIAQLNVIENIEVPMYYQGITEKDSAIRATELAEMVGLGNRIKHRPNELSGGQQQRVGIARALSNDPVMILADEPTGNLDTQSGGEILDILHDLHQKGKTLVVVTHDPAIGKHAQRTIHLMDGMIEKDQRNHH